MKSEPNPNPYNPLTIPPEPLTAADLALATDLACYWLKSAGPPPLHNPAAEAAYEGKRRDVQRLRMRLMHHQVNAERQAGRAPA